MLATPVMMFLLASATSGNHVLEEATSSCGAAAAMESTRCLIQQQKATFQTAKLHKAEEKSKWTGSIVDVEFASTAVDMSGASTYNFIDYDTVDPNVTGNVTKTGIQIKFEQKEGGQIVSDSDKDLIKIYGFTAGTSGIVNSNANRIWVGNPVTPKQGKGRFPQLLYGITMTNVPGNSDWNYHVEFSKSPPAALKIVPKNGKVAQIGNVAALGLICNDPVECADGDIVVSAVQFTPITAADKNAMKNTHLLAQEQVPADAAAVLDACISDEEADDAEKEEAEEEETAAETDKSELAQMQHQEAKEEKSKWTGSIVDEE